MSKNVILKSILQQPIFFAGAYLLAIFIGSTIGAMIVSNKPVLELLQVKE